MPDVEQCVSMSQTHSVMNMTKNGVSSCSVSGSSQDLRVTLCGLCFHQVCAVLLGLNTGCRGGDW